MHKTIYLYLPTLLAISDKGQASLAIGLFQKKKQGELRIYFSENHPGISFFFFTLLLRIPDKTKLNPLMFHKILLDPLEIPRPKAKTWEILNYFFLVTLGNSTSFLIKPWKFHMLFLWYSWKFHIMGPPICTFSGIAHFINYIHTTSIKMPDFPLNAMEGTQPW